METKITKPELMLKIKALGKITKEQRNEIICSFIGHSNILTGCFGYMSCARCNAQIGDTIGGSYSNDKAVIVGHNCDVCQSNFKKLTWQDKLYVVNPFKVKQ